MSKIWVRCPKGVCPRPDSSQVIKTVPVQVPDTEYYRRRLADRSLELVSGPKTKPLQNPPKETT